MGFKAGNYNAFGIHWMGTKTIAFFFKLKEDELEGYENLITKYDTNWKQAYHYIDFEKTKTQDFVLLFEKAAKKLIGE